MGPADSHPSFFERIRSTPTIGGKIGLIISSSTLCIIRLIKMIWNAVCLFFSRSRNCFQRLWKIEAELTASPLKRRPLLGILRETQNIIQRFIEKQDEITGQQVDLITQNAIMLFRDEGQRALIEALREIGFYLLEMYPNLKIDSIEQVPLLLEKIQSSEDSFWMGNKEFIVFLLESESSIFFREMCNIQLKIIEPKKGKEEFFQLKYFYTCLLREINNPKYKKLLDEYKLYLESQTEIFDEKSILLLTLLGAFNKNCNERQNLYSFIIRKFDR